jgi:hypothetical protein
MPSWSKFAAQPKNPPRKNLVFVRANMLTFAHPTARVRLLLLM